MLFLFLIDLFIASASECENASDCEKCLTECYKTHFWCVNDNTCRPLTSTGADLDDSSAPFGTCRFYESHDLIFNATECCSTKPDYTSCTKGSLVSYCQWCPTSSHGTPQCLYKYDTTHKAMVCDVPPESFAKCSGFTSCTDCTNNLLCVWCEENGSCIPKDSQEDPQSSYYCETTTDNCCFDRRTCEECSNDSGPFDNQVCVWCNEEKQCKTLAAALTTCNSTNRLGVRYCEDRCYSRSSSCSHCVADLGCIWISNLRWTQSIGVPKDLTELCTAGSLSGPKSKIINYQSSSTGRYEFVVQEFYHMNCSLKSSSLITLISVLVVSIVALIIIILVITTIVKRLKYAKALKNAREEAAIIPQDNDGQEDSDEAERNEIARLVKPVSWE